MYRGRRWQQGPYRRAVLALQPPQQGNHRPHTRALWRWQSRTQRRTPAMPRVVQGVRRRISVRSDTRGNFGGDTWGLLTYPNRRAQHVAALLGTGAAGYWQTREWRRQAYRPASKLFLAERDRHGAQKSPHRSRATAQGQFCPSEGARSVQRLIS